MDFPTPVKFALPTMPSYSIDAAGAALAGFVLSTTASMTMVANQAYYYPFVIHQHVTAVKMSYIVGATPTGNVDLGIYDAQGNRLVSSGSVAQGTANTLQEVDITDTPLAPGAYLMAIQFSSGAGTAFGVNTGGDENTLACWPLYEQAVGSFGLPATATPVISANGTPAVVYMAVHFDTLV